MKGRIPRKGLIAHWQNSDVLSQIIVVSTLLYTYMVVWSGHNEIVNFSVCECQKLSCVLAKMLYSPFPTKLYWAVFGVGRGHSPNI